MLTPSNQYLRPEYLSPLPTTLDAKKSPLALLAQTCSNIGVDTPNNKPMIPPIEKPKDRDSSKLVLNGVSTKDGTCTSSATNTPSCDEISVSNINPSSGAKSCFKPYELGSKCDEKDDQKRERQRTSPVNGSQSSGAHIRSSSISPNFGSRTTCRSSPHSKGSPSPLSENGAKSSCSDLSSLSSAVSAVSSNPSRPLDSSIDHLKDSLGASGYLASAYKSGLVMPNPLAPSSCVGCTISSSIPPTDNLTSTSYASGLLAAQNGYSSLKVGAFSAASMSPYVGYARMKTPAGSTTIVPVCRDPYCTNCQYSGLTNALGATCPSGCTQCKHDPLSLGSHLVPGLSAALYPQHSMLSAAAAAAHSMPYVCNWIAGDSYCGKRFTTSEELLQHLRTHTNPSGAVTETALPLGLSLPSSVPTALGGCHMHYSSAPSLTSPAGLRRTYPPALDSLSASRYHPYKPSLVSSAAVPPMHPLPHPGLSPYFSPYSMYGQRFGAAVHP